MRRPCPNGGCCAPTKQKILILKLAAAYSCEAFAHIEKSKHYNIKYLKPSG